MTISEKVAYLKGLAEGYGMDENTKEGKLLGTVMDILSDLALDVEDLEDSVGELTEQVDAIDEDLDTLETDYYDEYDADEDDESDEDEEFFDVTCPSCNQEFSVDESTLLDGQIECPHCGEHLEFDLSAEECDCDGCSSCQHDDEE